MGRHIVFMTWPTEGRMDRMSETSFALHGEKLAQIWSPAFMRRPSPYYSRVWRYSWDGLWVYAKLQYISRGRGSTIIEVKCHTWAVQCATSWCSDELVAFLLHSRHVADISLATRYVGFNYQNIFSGEEDFSHLKLVGASRDVAGHEIRLAAELEPDSEASPWEDESESLGTVTGKVNTRLSTDMQEKMKAAFLF